MKKNILFTLIAFGFASHTAFGMQNELIIDEKQEQDIKPLDTVNEPMPDVDLKNRFNNESNQDSNNQIQSPKIPQPTIIQNMTATVVNIFSNATNKMSKVTGYRDVTEESSSEFSTNISNISKITTAESFMNDWKNNSPISNNPSYLKKGIDRLYEYQVKAVNTIYLMQTKNSYDVESLTIMEKSMEKSEAYHTAISDVCKQQHQMIKNKINEKLNSNKSSSENINNDKEDINTK